MLYRTVSSVNFFKPSSVTPNASATWLFFVGGYATMKSGKVLSVSKVVMLPPAGVRGLYNLIAGSPGRKKGGMLHGVE